MKRSQRIPSWCVLLHDGMTLSPTGHAKGVHQPPHQPPNLFPWKSRLQHGNSTMKTAWDLTYLLVHNACTHHILLVHSADAHGEDRDGGIALLPQKLHEGLQRTQCGRLNHHTLGFEIHLHHVREVAHHLCRITATDGAERGGMFRDLSPSDQQLCCRGVPGDGSRSLLEGCCKLWLTAAPSRSLECVLTRLWTPLSR